MAPTDTTNLIPERAKLPSQTSVRKVTPNMTTISHPFAVNGMVKVGARCILCKTRSGRIAAFSPVPLTPPALDAVAALGDDVGWIVSVNPIHHLFMAEWKKRWPRAKVVGPEGLPEKRAKQGEETLPFDAVIGEKLATTTTRAASEKARRAKVGGEYIVDEEFDTEFDYEFMAAHFNKELLFYFRRDEALIEGDVWFNIPAVEQYSKTDEDPTAGLVMRMVTAMNGAPGQSLMGRIKWYLFSKGNTEGMRGSVMAVDAWKPKMIIPCHGELIEEDGQQVWRSIFPDKYWRP